MDQHLTKDHATDAEKSAVDSELGAPESGWSGGARHMAHDGRVAISPAPHRDLLLPVLHAIQRRIGWISRGAINYVASRLDVPPAEIHGVASFYAMFSLAPRPRIVAHVCDDIACLIRGAGRVCAQLEKTLGPAGAPNSKGNSTWVRSPCLGLCERAPAVLISASGETPHEQVLAPAVPDSIASALRQMTGAQPAPEHKSPDTNHSLPQSGVTPLRLLRRIGHINPASLSDFQRQGGYEALRRAIEIGPERVVREVIDSRLLGRGGAAFPTGKKWESLQLARKPGATHYVVCNADESEPGTFKDRVIMEGDPFAILEGMAIAALAVGAAKGFIYVRGEYPHAAACLTRAIKESCTHGFLGRAILGSNLEFDVELRQGAGAYICGEETALFNSIEGYRGEPRNKPPFPTQAGLFRKPTLVNNVETLINVPEIILNGGAAYARIGTAQSSGYRLFCLSGNIQRPGVYEMPFGITLKDLIAAAGGVGGTGRLQAVLLGGAAGSFLSPAEINIPLSFEGTRAAGATLGSGAVIVLDDSVDMKEFLLRIARFFHEETCGQCVPCRVGTERQQELLARLAARRPVGSAAQEINLLKEMAQAMRDASICGLGQTASSAILSATERWNLFS
ncbi:MAG: NAD(P)H-dependent oxidoreductase subunit E [Candidatus Acidiferrales bacterium]